MALYDTYGPKASASRQLNTSNTSPLAKVKAPTAPSSADPQASTFNRTVYQRDYMRQRRRRARAAKA